MRRFIPHVHELALFAALAVAFSAAVHLMNPKSADLSLMTLGAPMFLVAAILGLRRSPLWTRVAEETESDESEMG
ncbi:MAG TPA: hypothetical protein VF669_10550 [Tepidisphaeraceae bacterium]|jgi:hypothetical protein